MKLQITLRGPILAISETQVFGSGFRKRTCVVENVDDKDRKYNQPIIFEFHKDNVDKLDNFDLGNEVEITADLQGNEHNSKFYIALRAWKIVRVGAGEPKSAPDRNFSRPPERESRERSATAPTSARRGDEDEDEIPF